jgi:hypothetical protein
VEHSIIGVWTITLKSSRRPHPDHATAAFHADGTMTMTISGYTAHGAWRGTDPVAAKFRALAPLGAAEGQTGWHTLDFDARFAPDGETFTLVGSYARPTPSGTPWEASFDGSAERLTIGDRGGPV